MKSEERYRDEKLKLEKEKLNQETTFQPQKQISHVPAFNEHSPNDFFREFERTAKHMRWPEEEWTWLMGPELMGKPAIEDLKD